MHWESSYNCWWPGVSLHKIYAMTPTIFTPDFLIVMADPSPHDELVCQVYVLDTLWSTWELFGESQRGGGLRRMGGNRGFPLCLWSCGPATEPPKPQDPENTIKYKIPHFWLAPRIRERYRKIKNHSFLPVTSFGGLFWGSKMSWNSRK